jgi:hypothetical protein
VEIISHLVTVECGLTLVDRENCPTDSIPLLWYQSPADSGSELKISKYVAPFPRTHSRLGDQKRNVALEKWNLLITTRCPVLRLSAVGICKPFLHREVPRLEAALSRSALAH